MNVCGKALPPSAATLLGTNIVLLVICVPLLLTFHSFAIVPGGSAAGRFTETLIRLVAIGLFCQAVFYCFELYNLRITRSLCDQIWKAFGAVGLVMLVLALVFWVFPDLSPGRDALLGLPLASIGVLIFTRLTAIPARKVKVVLVGPESSRAYIQASFTHYPEWNMEVTGSYCSESLAQLSPAGPIDRIIVSADAQLGPQALERLIQMKMSGIRVESAAQFYEQTTGRVQLDQVDHEWFVFSSGFDNNRRKLIMKRCFDVVFASILLVVQSPIMLLAILAILIENKGPLFYPQDRIGQHGRVFKIFKFRTMVPAPPNPTPQWTANNDKRITRLGQIMRTFRIDEFPQLINVLKGDMSLVGPRPEQPYFCELLAKEIPFYHQRHTVPPGLTGWAQVRYMYGASIEESKRKLEFDLFYVKNLSIWLDLAIAFETAKVMIVGQGAK